MGSWFNVVLDWMNGVPEAMRDWFFGLNREEWIVVLALIAALGFAFVTGFRSRRI